MGNTFDFGRLVCASTADRGCVYATPIGGQRRRQPGQCIRPLAQAVVSSWTSGNGCPAVRQ